MNITLDPAQFVNNKLTVNYGIRKKAIFTIIDEDFPGLTTIGTINVVTALIQQLATDGSIKTQNIYTPIISIGNLEIQVVPISDRTIMGQRLSKDNMQACTVTLVE